MIKLDSWVASWTAVGDTGDEHNIGSHITRYTMGWTAAFELICSPSGHISHALTCPSHVELLMVDLQHRYAPRSGSGLCF